MCCGDDDESYTMRPVEYEVDITVKDGISLCRFLTDHFCSYCLYHHYKDENKHTIAASYLMPNLNDLGFQNNFSVEIWFIYSITLCLKRNRELYECRGLKYVMGYLFEAPSNEEAHIVFTLNYLEKIDGWNISHDLSKEIKAKKVNFYNYYKHKEDLQASEENKLFPPRFTLWIKNPGLEHVCSTDLDANITITLYDNKNHKNKVDSVIFKVNAPRVHMLTEVLSSTSKDAITLPNHNCDDNRPTFKELLKYKDKNFM